METPNKEQNLLPVLADNTTIDQEIVMDAYMDYVLEHNARPKNMYQLAKIVDVPEVELYTFYSNFNQIEADFFVKILESSKDLASEATGYERMSAEQRLLTFYYIFFENLAIHRSFVLFVMQNWRGGALTALQQMRTLYMDYVNSLDFQQPPLLEKIPFDFFGLKEKARGELLWGHFLSIIEFWRTDNSPEFEKTDLYIEKSISTGTTLLSGETAQKIVDLGRFVYHEKVGKRL